MEASLEIDAGISHGGAMTICPIRTARSSACERSAHFSSWTLIGKDLTVEVAWLRFKAVLASFRSPEVEKKTRQYIEESSTRPVGLKSSNKSSTNSCSRLACPMCAGK